MWPLSNWLVKVQLNSTMRLMCGTLHFTAFLWLPVLANTELPALQRKAATHKLVEKIIAHDNWPIHVLSMHTTLN